MNVLIDAHMLGSKEGGNERYIHSLLDAFKELHKTDIHSYKKNDSNNFKRLLVDIPREVKRWDYDIVHSTYNAPLVKNAKFVVTLHDVSFKRFPEFFNLKDRLMFDYLLPISLHRADAIIVPSEFTKKEAIKYYPYIGHKTYITPYAANKIFEKNTKFNLENKIFTKLAIKKPFILSLNSRNPKKNIQTVIHAFNKIRSTFTGLNLVIIGGDHNIDMSTLSSRIRIIDYVKDDVLNSLYNLCEIFIYYSVYEGFGLPLLEASNCHTAIIASDTEVHREVTKDKLLYGLPGSAEDLSLKISAVLKDYNLRKNFADKAKEIAQLYSWQKTASLTYKIYQSLIT